MATIEENVVENNLHNYIFATLTCADIRTNDAVGRLLDSLRDTDTHHRKRIARPAGWLAASELGEDAEDAAEEDDRPLLRDLTSYVFSLSEDHAPFRPKDGFVLGTGEPMIDPHTKAVDVLLPSAPAGSDTQVQKRHAYFVFDSQYGRFWLHARHKGVRVDGLSLQPHTKRFMESSAHIDIGPYHFVFEFKIRDESFYQEKKASFLTRVWGEDIKPFASTSATPSKLDRKIGDWLLHNVVGKSQHAIYAASNIRTAEAVAAKQFLFPDVDETDLQHELDTYQAITTDLSGQRYAKFVMQKHSLISGKWSSDQYREQFLLWTPLVRTDFSNSVDDGDWWELSEETRRILFVQVLLGLTALHDAGWIHRDINPSNLGIAEIGRHPYAVIIGLEEAKPQVEGGNSPDDDHRGLRDYSAPEVYGEEFSLNGKYDERVDVWSMGAVAYFLFVGRGKVDWAMDYEMFGPNNNLPFADRIEPLLITLDMLLGQPDDSMNHLIGSMLRLEPEKRITLRQALAHPALRDFKAAVDSQLHADKLTGEKRPNDFA